MAPDSHSTPSFRPSVRELLLWGTLILVMLGILGVNLLRTASPRRQPLPVLMTLPSFSLTHHDGSTLDLERLAGHSWVAGFIFTRCPGICPRMTRQMAKVGGSLPKDSPVRLVSFSVDPDYDTPQVLAAYARQHGAAEGWYFATGTREEIFSLCRDGFKLAVNLAPEVSAADSPPGTTPASPIEPIVHSNRLVLVDGEGQVRGYYDAFDDVAMARLLVDIASLG